MKSTVYRRGGKRLVDMAASLMGLLLLSPLLLGLWLLVRWRLGSPALFVQERPGLRGKPFRLVKFRTMTDARDAQGKLLPDAVRLTRFGRFLRASSLDELPELWNVLNGEMSLVGPRPLLMQYLPLYSERQMHRHDVLPGITGLAQVRGRNDLEWSAKFELDLEYVNNYTFLGDMRIILETIGKVVTRAGVTKEGHVTTDLFKGVDHEKM